jgi:hypothetical protein
MMLPLPGQDGRRGLTKDVHGAKKADFVGQGQG